MTGVRDGWVTLPTGARIHYERASEGDPLLPLHGIASSTQVWRRLIPQLARGHDVIAIDLPGCGMLTSGSSISGQAVSALDRLGMCLFPALIIWGRNDGVFPVAHAERAARLVPHARLVLLDDCGHFPQFEAADGFGSALAAWLEEARPERLDLAALRQRLDRPQLQDLPDQPAEHDDDEAEDDEPPRGDATPGVGLPADADEEEGAAGEPGGHRHAGADGGEGDADDAQQAEAHQLSMPRALA